MRHLKMVAITILLASCETALAQRPEAEYFQLVNNSDQTCWVYLKSLGRNPPDEKYQPGTTVRAGRSQKVRLRGLEPFDILILRKDGTSTEIKDQYLCTFMQQCRDGLGNLQHWQGIDGHWEVDKNNETQISGTQTARMIRATSDVATVSIEEPRPPRKK